VIGYSRRIYEIVQKGMEEDQIKSELNVFNSDSIIIIWRIYSLTNLALNKGRSPKESCISYFHVVR